MVGGNEDFFAQIIRGLPHAAHACNVFPAVGLGALVVEIVVHRVQQEIQAGFVGRFFKFLPAVLLIADGGLQGAFSQDQGVVPDRLVVVHLLEGEAGPVAFPVVEGLQRAVFFPFSFHHAGCQVEPAQFQVGISPSLAQADKSGNAPLPVAGVGDQAVGRIPVVVRYLLGPAPVPDQAVLVAGRVHRIAQKAVVGLIFRSGTDPDLSLRRYGCPVQHNYAGQGIRPIHQGGGTFEDLYGVDALGIHFHAVLVAPLLAFLPYAVGDHQHPVVAHAADHRLGDAPAGGDLRHAGLFGQRVNQIGRGLAPKDFGRDNGDRGRGVPLGLGAGEACHHHLAQCGVGFFKGEVQGADRFQVYVLDNGLVPQQGNLYLGSDLGERADRISALHV